jgi:hypothetical protein
VNAREIAAKCGCGRVYTRAEWEKLRFVGWQHDGEERIELRNCDCGSTFVLLSDRARTFASALRGEPASTPRRVYEPRAACIACNGLGAVFNGEDLAPCYCVRGSIRP